MISSGLLISSFNLKERYKKNNKEEYVCLNEYKNGSYVYDFNIINCLEQFMKEHTKSFDDDKLMKIFSIDESSIIKEERDDFCYISCIIKCGNYGINSDITNRKTKKIVYTKQADDADVKNFNCVFYVPKNRGDYITQKGIVAFQTIGNYGIKTITIKLLKSFFSNMSYTFETRCISTTAFLKKAIEGNGVKKITFIKNIKSVDDSDNLLVTSGKQELTYYNPMLKIPVIYDIMKILENKKNNGDTINVDSRNNLIEIQEESYEDIKLHLKVGSFKKIIFLSKIDNFSIVEEIPLDKYKESLHNPMILIEHMICSITTYTDYLIMHKEVDKSI